MVEHSARPGGALPVVGGHGCGAMSVTPPAAKIVIDGCPRR
jgi:hypothetical protein